jgi:hypothetical protein
MQKLLFQQRDMAIDCTKAKRAADSKEPIRRLAKFGYPAGQ